MRISFVVQGPIINTNEISTIRVVDSIRKFYPNSEIILSTWVNEQIQDIDFDKVILNVDPGCFIRNDGHVININRQIVSSLEGIIAASYDIVVKIRTDTLVIRSAIENIINKTRCGLQFENHIIPELFTRDPLKIQLLFHPSDLIYIGIKQDLTRLFSIPLARRSDILNDFGEMVICPEQYIWLNFLKNNNKHFDHRNYDISNIFSSEKLLHSNFKVLSCNSLGVQFTNRIISGWESDKVHEEKLSKFYSRWRGLLSILIAIRLMIFFLYNQLKKL